MSKNIVIISPVATHPQDAGHRSRIFSLASMLKHWGNQVFMVYLQGRFQQTSPDSLPAMRQYWGSHLFLPDFEELANAKKKGWSGDASFADDWEADDWYDDRLDPFLRNLERQLRPDIVFVEYAYLSKALECFEDSTLKVVDTFDVFACRNRKTRQAGIRQTYPAPSFTENAESEALERADVVVAIQEDDHVHFSQVTDKKVLTVGHTVELHKPGPKRPSGHKMLFFGSASDINRSSLQWFSKEILPAIRAAAPKAELWVAGFVCNRNRVAAEGVRNLGYVPDISAVLEEVDVVVNPNYFATGLSIKTMTTLGHGKPLVSTRVGVRGLEHGAGEAFLVARDTGEFAEHVIRVLSDPELAAELSRGAFLFAKRSNEKNASTLCDLVGRQSNLHLPKQV
ncbi:MAG: glycosyltransferase [Candidatus Binatia bacterium]|nr:glycosyltransferase [Candidatus Binatia bacterium]